IERRDQPVYLLVRARPDSPLGAGLQPTTIECFNPADRKVAAENARATGRPTASFSIARVWTADSRSN
ncbi:MAG TPA: hypothetical protein VFT26_07435, partial [Pyrinomonadaceae bacterium]|nr:hypothetical protein [Pyrinomonadaceae bacterium]